jgi:hypothetical protein
MGGQCPEVIGALILFLEYDASYIECPDIFIGLN